MCEGGGDKGIEDGGCNAGGFAGGGGGRDGRGEGGRRQGLPVVSATEAHVSSLLPALSQICTAERIFTDNPLRSPFFRAISEVLPSP